MFLAGCETCIPPAFTLVVRFQITSFYRFEANCEAEYDGDIFGSKCHMLCPKQQLSLRSSVIKFQN